MLKINTAPRDGECNQIFWCTDSEIKNGTCIFKLKINKYCAQRWGVLSYYVRSASDIASSSFQFFSNYRLKN